ncbi:MAG: ABC transporter ATP-binding protein/permease [Ruminococcus sp.]|nr:ABC transporter ATP-binding protein/permease [Ruminococcus sp.]
MNQRQTLKKVFKYTGKYKFFLIVSIVLSVITVALTLYIPIITGNAIDLIVDKGRVDFDGILPLIKKMILIILATSIIQWLMNICNNHLTYGIVKDIRDEAFSKIQSLPLKYIDGHSTGDLVSRVISDADTFADGLLMGFTQLFTGVATIIGTLIFMISVNFKISLVVILITPISFVVAGLIAKNTYAMFKKQSETLGEETAFIDEMIGDIKTVQSFGYQHKAINDFDEINNRLGGYSKKAIFYSSITNPATRFINNLVYVGVGLTGAISVISGNLSVGQLQCFLSYANQYTKPFNEISGVVTELQNALACASRIFELIEEPKEVINPKAITLDSVNGDVSFKDVKFSYNPEQRLIENFTLDVKSGQRVAIVGKTGCGKTTLINLLMRFYDTTSGTISIDGIDIKDITRESLREHYGMVLQETWIKTATVKENITIGKPNASDEEIIQAAKSSYAHSFIKRLPNGYDTIIKDDGTLSQGQKQLLCITRVMLAIPSILILDEATSSIDTRTEIKIQKAFSNLMQGRTSFIVAHRLSTIKEADIILVMDSGHVVEMGNHDELLKNRGFYYNLWNSQFS